MRLYTLIAERGGTELARWAIQALDDDDALSDAAFYGREIGIGLFDDTVLYRAERADA